MIAPEQDTELAAFGLRQGGKLVIAIVEPVFLAHPHSMQSVVKSVDRRELLAIARQPRNPLEEHFSAFGHRLRRARQSVLHRQIDRARRGEKQLQVPSIKVAQVGFGE